MDLDTAWRTLLSLSPEARSAVVALIEDLKLKSFHGRNPVRNKVSKDLLGEPFVGMWRDREDLSDSSAWVRGCRQREWKIPRA